MFEKERHCRIQQRVDIPGDTLIVYKLVFCRAFESCQPEQALGVVIKITTEQHYGSIVKFPVMQQTEFFKNGRQVFPYGCFG